MHVLLSCGSLTKAAWETCAVLGGLECASETLGCWSGEEQIPKVFHLLQLPEHYREYSIFERDILSAVWSVDAGFGMVYMIV